MLILPVQCRTLALEISLLRGLNLAPTGQTAEFRVVRVGLGLMWRWAFLSILIYSRSSTFRQNPQITRRERKGPIGPMCEHRAFQVLQLACISFPQTSNPMRNRARLAPKLHYSPQTFIQLNNLTVSIVFTLAATLQCTQSQTFTARPGLAARQGWNWARSLLDADDSCWKGACEMGLRVFFQSNIGLTF